MIENPLFLMLTMANDNPNNASTNAQNTAENSFLYCPTCAVEVPDPLTCGDCSAVICRRCGTSLEAADELGMG